jgi:hypothetical protein
MAQTFYPSSVDQFSNAPDQEIGWSSFFAPNTRFLLNSRWRTLEPLTHLSNPATGDLRNRTWSLICTGFNIPELTSVSGLELRVAGQRNGRIVDEVIQLTYQGQSTGINNFVYITDPDGNLPIKNETVYGGPTDLWGTNLTPIQLTDPTFGVILKFQSHPYFPHRCGMFLDSVSLTVY